MKNRFSFKWNPLALFPLIGLFFLLIFFLYYFLMIGNPDAFNAFPDEMTSDAYLGQSSNVISLTFATILFLYLIVLSLDLLFRNGSSHILMVLVGELIISAYAITKTAWTFNLDSTRQTMSIIFLIIGDIGLISMHYFFLKKALDGDHDIFYTICLYVAGIFLYFGLVQYDSLLDAYSHLGDLVFWGDYGIAHLMVALYVGLAFINLKSDFDPEPLELNDTHVDLSKGN